MYNRSPAIASEANTGLPDGTSKIANHWQTPAAVRALIEHDKVAEWTVFADNEPIRKLMRGETGANPG